MSRNNRPGDTERLTLCLTEMLAAGRRDLTLTGAEPSGGGSDSRWAKLLGPAGVSVTADDLRIDDMLAFVARLFDLAVDQWFEQAESEAVAAADEIEIDDSDDPFETEPNQQPATFFDDLVVDDRSGPRIVDSVLSEISTGFQAAVFTATCSKYTASGVRRSSAV